MYGREERMPRRFGIVERYALESLVLSVVIAVALGAAVTWRMDAAIRDANGRAAAVLVGALVSHQVEGADLSRPLTGDVRSALDELVTHNLAGHGITYVKVFAPDGTLVYSPDRVGEGERYVEAEDVKTAMGGGVTTEIVRSSTETESSRQYDAFGDVLEIYAPLADPTSGETVGVFELYESYAPVRQQTVATNLLIWGIVLLGGLVLYATQVQIVRSAVRQLDETTAQAEEVNERLVASLKDLEEHSLGTLQALIAAVDAKDAYTARHSLAVTEYALAIGRRMGLDERRLRVLERAGLLHDVGKIGVAESVLLKPSGLSDEEWLEIRDHSDIGARIIESIPFLRELVEIVRHHHERWDGKGYPAGIRGEDVPEEARILAVADAFDAMTSDRPYRQALRVSVAREELLRWRGVQFDPRAIDAFLEALDYGDISLAGKHQPGGARVRTA